MSRFLFSVVCVFLLCACSVKKREVTSAPLTIEVIAKRHKWLVRYAGKDGKLGRADFRQYSENNPGAIDSADVFGKDDVLESDTLFLPRGENVQLWFRSLDVIHSAYIPHMSVQANCVPGIRTTLDLSEILQADALNQKPYYDYLLLCNKICGAGHYQMNMKVRVK